MITGNWNSEIDGQALQPTSTTPDQVERCAKHTHRAVGQVKACAALFARFSLVHGAGLRGNTRQGRSPAVRCRHCALRRNREDEGCQYGDKPFDRLVLLGSLPYTCSLSTS